MSSVNKPQPQLAESRFRFAFENAPIGMAMVGTNHRLQKVNASLCEALGYSEEELLTKTVVEITHPDDVRKDRDLAEKLFNGEIPNYRLEKRFFTKDGRLVWLDLSAFVICGDNGKPAYGLAMVENITERKRAEEGLRTSEERYRSFVVNSSEAIWRFEIEKPVSINLPVNEQIDCIYKYAYLAECNDAMAQLYGHDRADDIMGARLGEFVKASNPTNMASLRAFVTNGYRLHNTGSIEPDAQGSEKFFASSVIGIVMNGYLLRVWGTQRDETERRVAENQLKHSREQLRALASHLQALREKERADIAREMHDVLGQWLTSLKIDLSWIAKRIIEMPDDKNRTEILGRLKSSSELIERTIAAAKAISTELRPGVLDKFGLAAAIEWQCQEFAHRTGIKTEFRLPPGDLRVSPEASTTLFRILQEALNNVARHSQATNVDVRLTADEAELTLSVRDDGRGITADEIAAPDSLGLLGMRERAEMLGGTFIVEGKPGRTVINAQVPNDPTEIK